MRKLITLFALLAMISAVAPATNVFAAGSPVGEPVTDEPETDQDGDDEEETTKSGSNDSDKSPQTGNDLAFVYVALIGAAGASLIARKKITE